MSAATSKYKTGLSNLQAPPGAGSNSPTGKNAVVDLDPGGAGVGAGIGSNRNEQDKSCIFSANTYINNDHAEDISYMKLRGTVVIQPTHFLQLARATISLHKQRYKRVHREYIP